MTSTMVPRQNWTKKSSHKVTWSEQKAPQLSDFVVSPGFAYNIARFYPSSVQIQDKDLCVKLMQKLGLTADPTHWYRPVTRSPKPRPPSAPTRRRNMDSFSKNPNLFYMTTNKREFGGGNGSPASNARPQTAKIFPNRLTDEETTYQTEFCEKRSKLVEPIRTGTSSGVRRNNPHPSEAFMIWKFPGHLPPLDPAEHSGEDMVEVNYDQLKSTYQNDYTGIPQGVCIQTAFDGDVKEDLPKPPYTLDSTARYSYQSPKTSKELMCSLTRYGCNKNKYKATVGAVPTVCTTSPQMHLSGRTEYKDEFYKKALLNIYGEQRWTKSGPIPALEEFLKSAKPQEKDALVKELKRIAKNENRATKEPQWFSKWTGPS